MAIGQVLMIAGGLGKAGSSLLGGQAEEQAAEFNEAMALRNAEFIEHSGRIQELFLRREQQKDLGMMRANFGASGVTLEGSPLDMLAESAAFAALDVATLRYNTEVKAQGARLEAQMQASRAESAGAASILNFGANILNTAGAVL